MDNARHSGASVRLFDSPSGVDGGLIVAPIGLIYAARCGSGFP